MNPDLQQLAPTVDGPTSDSHDVETVRQDDSGSEVAPVFFIGDNASVDQLPSENANVKQACQRTAQPVVNDSPVCATSPEQRLRHLSIIVENPQEGINDIWEAENVNFDSATNSSNYRSTQARIVQEAYSGNLPLFIELSELGKLENNKNIAWIERARWIKFEEDVDIQLHHWDAPHISILCFSDLLTLRNSLQLGTTILDSENKDINSVFEDLVQNFTSTGQLQRSQRSEFLNVLSLPHRHEGQQKRIKSSVTDFVRMRKVKSRAVHLNDRHDNSSADNQQRSTTSPNLLSPPGLNSGRHSNSSSLFWHPIARLEHLRSTHQHASHQQHSPHIALMDAHSHCQINLMRRIPEGTCAFVVMVGVVKCLSKPLFAFVRFKAKCIEDSLVEIPLPLKFLLIFVGPTMPDDSFYYNVGRTMCALMNDQEFRKCAFVAKQKKQLIDAISQYISRCMLFPHLDYDRMEQDHVEALANNIIQCSRHLLRQNEVRRRTVNDRRPSTSVTEDDLNGSITNRRRSSSHSYSPRLSDDGQGSNESLLPFVRTKRFFGAYQHEFKMFTRSYGNSIRNVLHGQCLTCVLFLFVSCLSMTLTFAAILSEETHHSFSIVEMLLAASMDGLIFGVLSGQPLTIIGPTGPMVIFDGILHLLCTRYQVNYFGVRFYVSCWIAMFAIIMVSFDGAAMIQYVTRFSEEIFSVVMALTYLVEPMRWLYETYKSNPVLPNYNDSLITTIEMTSAMTPSVMRSVGNDGVSSLHYDTSQNSLPNVALLSSILLFGTAGVALILRRIRYSKAFTRWFRLFASDMSLPISMLLMICLDFVISQGNSFTKKLEVVEPAVKFLNTANFSFKQLFDPPLPVYIYVICVIPAILIFIVIFIETELCGMYIKDRLDFANGRSPRNSGFYMDLLLTSFLVLLNSVLHLPWIAVAPVRTVAHVSSLSIHSKTFAPGEKPKVISIIDQRVTNVVIHLLLGLTIFAMPGIRHIALAILFGAFLYLGIVTLSCTQLFHRMYLIAYSDTNLPYLPYARQVSSHKRNAYTIIQLLLVITILVVKFSAIAYVFPIIVVALVPIRMFIIGKLFNEKDLCALDSDEVVDRTDDFFSQIHFPP